MDNLQDDNEEGAREEESQHGSIGEERRVDLCGMLLGGIFSSPRSCRRFPSSSSSSSSSMLSTCLSIIICHVVIMFSYCS